MWVRACVCQNHDFDHGVPALVRLSKACGCPWIISNALDAKSGLPLAGGSEVGVVDHRGLRIGFVGLVEEAWLATLGTVDRDEVDYTDFVDAAARLERQLRDDAGCDMVIALCHMRTDNDIRLAKEVPGLDLVLGGHDHDFEVHTVAGTMVLKSGTDFRTLSQVNLVWTPPQAGEARGRVTAEVKRHDVTEDMPEDEETHAVVAQIMAQVGEELNKVVGRSSVPLDGRSSVVRTRESALGNLIADLMRQAVSADIALLNGGTIRSDSVTPAGDLRMRDVLRILPLPDQVLLVLATGATVLAALENAVSKYPSKEGRFMQVSGVTFSFDPSKPPGSRVVPGSVRVGGEPLDASKQYKVAMKEYIQQGKDGFEMFPACEVLIDAECGPALPTVLVNHLRMIGGLNSFSRVDNSVVSAAAKLGAVLQRKLRVCERFSLCPLIEGRIVNVQDSSTTTASDSNDLPPPKIELTRQLSDVVPGVGVDDRMAVPAGGTGGNGSVPSSSPLATAGHELAGTSLVLLHFNDVYHLGSREKDPCGGISRFLTAVKGCKAAVEGSRPACVLFSGDCLNPSTTSIVTKGQHMIDALNLIGVNAAVPGNHDFDFGIENLEERMETTSFPWILTNAFDKVSGLPLASCHEALVIDWHGVKIGLMGLIEREWLETLPTIDPSDVDYVDFVEVAREKAREMRGDGVDLVIALTHMRVRNDEKLAKEVPELDMVLGGHDHHYVCKQLGDVLLCKSGTDFRDLTEIKVTFGAATADGGSRPRPTLTATRVPIESKLEEDPRGAQLVAKYKEVMGAKMDQVLVETAVGLDCRFSKIRSGETNLGNMMADVVRAHTRADLVLLNSGGFRADQVQGPGLLRMRDLLAMFPLPDVVTVRRVPGSAVVAALENGVSLFPAFEGRFPQVSGMEFQFDPREPSGSRIVAVTSHGVPLDLEREYTVAVTGYVSRGKDGYGMLGPKAAEGEEDGDGEDDHDGEGPTLASLLRNYFRVIGTLNGFVRPESLAQRVAHHFSTLKSNAGERFVLHPKCDGRIVNVAEAGVASAGAGAGAGAGATLASA